jgi:hypothetical protein
LNIVKRSSGVITNCVVSPSHSSGS